MPSVPFPPPQLRLEGCVPQVWGPQALPWPGPRVVALLFAAPTSAPAASCTSLVSVKVAAAPRMFCTVVCGMTLAEAALCGPVTPSGPDVTAPVTAEGMNTPQGAMESGSATVRVTGR